MGIKVGRKALLHRDYKGDNLDMPSSQYLMKILQKQGDNQVLFAEIHSKASGVQNRSIGFTLRTVEAEKM
ncbi:hypothetical protein Dsin_031812 [Dipteronia sinensis]|uniref:Uncharacterized protein n=1 Tax=Dipteronia sinensis TaxID=43782 RepID=A0AAD9ZM28_9ROSI|nr:hypothetical protein Dsin_031812 [Dipteronia sinensis]